MNDIDDLSGKRFGRWTVLSQSPSKYKSRATMWHCRCECGAEKDISRTNLLCGKTKSCGCYRKEKSKELDESKRKYDQLGNISHKLCPMCGKFKEILNFPINSRRVDGYSEYCAECINYSLGKRYARYIRSAKNRKIKFTISKSEFDYITKQPCAYCGGYSTTYQGVKINGVDRINSELHYTTDNIVPCCTICNKMKLDYTKEEWIHHMKKILTYLEESHE